MERCLHYTIQLRQDSCITQSFTLRHPWQSAPDPEIPLSHENDGEKLFIGCLKNGAWTTYGALLVVWWSTCCRSPRTYLRNHSARAWAAFPPFPKYLHSGLCYDYFSWLLFLTIYMYMHYMHHKFCSWKLAAIVHDVGGLHNCMPTLNDTHMQRIISLSRLLVFLWLLRLAFIAAFSKFLMQLKAFLCKLPELVKSQVQDFESYSHTCSPDVNGRVIWLNVCCDDFTWCISAQILQKNQKNCKILRISWSLFNFTLISAITKSRILGGTVIGRLLYNGAVKFSTIVGQKVLTNCTC